MVVLVADQDAFAGAPHAVLRIMLFEALQSQNDRGILFWLAIFCSECVVAQRIQANRLGLVAIEVLGDDGPVCVRSTVVWRKEKRTHGYELCEASFTMVDIVAVAVVANVACRSCFATMEPSR